MLELAGVVILGVLAQWIAWRLKIPAILPLILMGLIVGPLSTVIFELSEPLLLPVWNGKRGLFPGDQIFHFTSLAVGVILFEGGLTLKKSEIKGLGLSIFRLITFGALITLIGGGIITHFTFELSWEMSFLISSLVIVTGPTVIAPILRNVQMKRDVATILKWEGILIDPVGAIIALIAYQLILAEYIYSFTENALKEFFNMIVVGGAMGFSAAHALAFAIKTKKIPRFLLNVFTLATVLMVYVISDLFAHESGLLAVVAMGIVMGNLDVPYIKQILNFKEVLSLLLISILFILLAANMTMADLKLMYSVKALGFFGMIILLRIFSVLLCTYRSGLKFREKLFIGWLGPRGIIAAGMASLFGLKLFERGEPGSEYITPVVFMIVLGSVVLNATTARPVAKLLKVLLRKSDDILIVGGSELSIAIAQYFLSKGKYATVIDSNPMNISNARKQGIPAALTNVFSNEGFDTLETGRASYLLCLTGNLAVDEAAIGLLDKSYGEKGSYRLLAEEEITQELKPKHTLFSENASLHNILKLYATFPGVKEFGITRPLSFQQIKMYADHQFLPLFIFLKTGNIKIFLACDQEYITEEGDALVYLGKLPEKLLV